MPSLSASRHTFPLTRPLVMGIVNVTPDSFSDGGRFLDPARALAHARQLLADGADIVDVGGESTRPGAEPVTEAEELARVIPIIETLAADGAVVSVDTMKAGVMRAAIAAGASMVNDVRALREPGALDAVAASDVAVCLMHMLGAPRTMQRDPAYGDVVAEVYEFLVARAAQLMSAGIAHERIVIDPGFGFGKTVAHNLALLQGLPKLCETGFPVLVGLSRKSMLGELTGRPAGQRLGASIASALLAAERGAALVRVHDVRETVDALNVWNAVNAIRE